MVETISFKPVSFFNNKSKIISENNPAKSNSDAEKKVRSGYD